MKKHPFKMLARLGYLWIYRENPTDPCVTQSYDRLSSGYDEAWTHHMRDLSIRLIDTLDPQPGSQALDLTCGTGFVTHLLAERIGKTVLGVDRSEGMIDQAKKNYGKSCEFVQQDILAYLKTCPNQTYDYVTCAWGLGYSRPLAVLKQIKRVLKPDGHVAIIDNTLFSLAEIMHSSFLTYLEQPHTLERLMRFRFLTSPTHLKLWFRLVNLHPIYTNKGTHSYEVKSGQDAVTKMKATGAAAGFEYASDPEHEKAVYDRFAEILEQRYRKNGIIYINHRYISGIARA